MIEFRADQNRLFLKYLPEIDGTSWILRALKESGTVKISRVFTFARADLVAEPNEADDDGAYEFEFRFAALVDSYYMIEGRIFGIPNTVLIADAGQKFERRFFVAERHVSIFRRLSKLVEKGQKIVIGGNQDGSIPFDQFEELLKKFPNTTELDRYANARVSSIIGEFIDPLKDFRSYYETYLNRQRPPLVSARRFNPYELLTAEINKFVLIRDTIVEWLSSSGVRSEREWQRMLLEFILLIFPRYIAVLENVQIEDRYSERGGVRARFIDIALLMQMAIST